MSTHVVPEAILEEAIGIVKPGSMFFKPITNELRGWNEETI